MKYTWFFQKKVIDIDKLLNNFQNKFEVVDCEKFASSSGKLPVCNCLTLKILSDSSDYGLNKNTNENRTDNVGQNFNVYILNLNHDVKRDDIIALKGFNEKLSFISGFDLWMFFEDFEVLNPSSTAGKGNN